MPSIFIGSSSEALQRGILPKLVTLLSDNFEIRPWDTAFDQGLFTLETLLGLIKEVDAALLIFAKDDAREFRGRGDIVTRDNVILEYGLFLAELGRERVWLLKETEVILPTDLNGLTFSSFSSKPSTDGTDSRLDADLRTSAAQITQKWKRLTKRGEVADSGLGLTRTLKRANEHLESTAERLRAFASNASNKSDEPLFFDSADVCITAYEEALEMVENRFWTTTYLSSGFWNPDNARVIRANEDMLKRLHQRNGDARRLFLLDKNIDEDVQARKRELIYLRQEGQKEQIRQLSDRLHRIEKDFQILASAGCQVKVAFDYNQSRNPLPNQAGRGYNPGDSEIAIYDRFRVDVFSGGKVGRITDLRVYSQATNFFEPILDSAEHYFEALWDGAEPSEAYIKRLRDAHAIAETHIDYQTNWLAKYEFALKKEDADLKTVEQKRVEEILRKIGRWGSINRYLDVGTCTARYPVALSDAVKPDGKIIGIDEDRDCVHFSIEKTRDDKRIQILSYDFGAIRFPLFDKFDLITCMMGTLSHFGMNRNPDTLDDLLQSVLKRMADFLTKDGILILSTWSEFACEQKEMLDIYLPRDRERLARWTPDRSRLKKRLDAAGLSIIEESQPDVRLDLFVCQRKSA